jgi:hypothetical protein
LLKNRKADGTVTVKRMWFIGAHDGSLREIPSERAHAPGKSAQSLGGLGLARFDDYVKAANLQQVSPQNRHSVRGSPGRTKGECQG